LPDWVDSDSLIVASRGPYRFNVIPAFWNFIQEKATQQILASSERVLNELLDGEDQLRDWAIQQQDTFFRIPTEPVQESYRQIVHHVSNDGRFARQHVTRFLAKADPWLLAHAKVEGGRIVTFEKSEPYSRRPKIPDVGNTFGIRCVNLWDLIDELGFTT
jgi:hypothetical protein